MENRINQIISTEEGNKFMILHQAIYDNRNYYVCCGVEVDTGNLDDNFYLFEEVKESEKVTLKIVEDEKLAKFLLKHLNLIEEDGK